MVPANRKTRILIVDDHALVRSGLAELIAHEPDMETCGEAADAPRALRLVDEMRPDLVVIDILLGKGSGVELIKQIKALDPSVRMVVSSMHDERIYAERVLNAGAMGYVEKREPSQKVIEAIRQVMSGRIYVSQSLADRLLRKLGQGSAGEKLSPLETLSDREIEVLGLVGQGLSTRQIAEQLNLSVKTIDTYREHLKTKLNLETASELVHYAVTWSLDQSGGPER